MKKSLPTVYTTAFFQVQSLPDLGLGDTFQSQRFLNLSHIRHIPPSVVGYLPFRLSFAGSGSRTVGVSHAQENIIVDILDIVWSCSTPNLEEAFALTSRQPETLHFT